VTSDDLGGQVQCSHDITVKIYPQVNLFFDIYNAPYWFVSRTDRQT